MMVRLLFLILVLSFTGCASMAGRGGPFPSGQEKKLARAVALLEQKKTSAAAELLTEVCAQPGVPGVTDEALFRLSLLHLGSGAERNAVARARQDLERLKKEYPASHWAPLAANLNATLAEDQAQIRKLKDLNTALARENKDLRQSIEQLRSLELELGKDSKR